MPRQLIKLKTKLRLRFTPWLSTRGYRGGVGLLITPIKSIVYTSGTPREQSTPRRSVVQVRKQAPPPPPSNRGGWSNRWRARASAQVVSSLRAPGEVQIIMGRFSAQVFNRLGGVAKQSPYGAMSCLEMTKTAWLRGTGRHWISTDSSLLLFLFNSARDSPRRWAVLCK